MRRIAATLVLLLAIAGCSAGGKAVSVEPEVDVGSGDGVVRIRAAAVTCGVLNASVAQEGNRLTVTARGHERRDDGRCDAGVGSLPPSGGVDVIDLTLPDGEYELIVGSHRSTFLWEKGAVATGAAGAKRTKAVALAAHTISVARPLFERLRAALPELQEGECAQSESFKARNPGYTPEFGCTWLVEATPPRPIHIVAPETIASTFGCAPQTDGRTVTCATDVDGEKVVIHVDEPSTGVALFTVDLSP